MKSLLLSLSLAASVVISANAQKAAYRIYVISFAKSGYKFSEADWALNAPKNTPVKIDFMVWLIKGNGRNILVDAGFLNDIPDAKDFQLSTYVRPDKAIAGLNVKAADITDVIISHPHWDHIDGTGLFPNAHIWIQKDDYYGLVNNWKLKKPQGGFAKRDADKLTALYKAGKVTLLDGATTNILPGINVYTGSKHTFNSQYVLVKTAAHKTVIASDNIWIYYNLTHLVPPSDGGTLDPVGYVNAMRKMKVLTHNDKYILPGHDAAVFLKFTQVGDSANIVEVK